MAVDLTTSVQQFQTSHPIVIQTGYVIDPATGTPLAVTTVFGQPAANGANTFIAAVASKKIRVLGYSIQASGTVTVKFADTAATDLSPAWTFQAREGIVMPSTPGCMWFETAAGLGVNVTLSAAVATNVSAYYVAV